MLLTTDNPIEQLDSVGGSDAMFPSPKERVEKATDATSPSGKESEGELYEYHPDGRTTYCSKLRFELMAKKSL